MGVEVAMIKVDNKRDVRGRVWYNIKTVYTCQMDSDCLVYCLSPFLRSSVSYSKHSIKTSWSGWTCEWHNSLKMDETNVLLEYSSTDRITW